MSDDQFDPAWVHECPSCARHAKELEAEAGIRCTGCLVLFNDRYPKPSEENPALCFHCLEVSKAPKLPPKRSWGTYDPKVRDTP